MHFCPFCGSQLIAGPGDSVRIAGPGDSVWAAGDTPLRAFTCEECPEHFWVRDRPPTLAEAVRACLPDLERYVQTHGPGPDRRLADLRRALESS